MKVFAKNQYLDNISCRRTTRGFGGVAILFRREVHIRIEILRTDREARHVGGNIYCHLLHSPLKGPLYNMVGKARLVDQGHLKLWLSSTLNFEVGSR